MLPPESKFMRLAGGHTFGWAQVVVSGITFVQFDIRPKFLITLALILPVSPLGYSAPTELWLRPATHPGDSCNNPHITLGLPSTYATRFVDRMPDLDFWCCRCGPVKSKEMQ